MRFPTFVAAVSLVILASSARAAIGNDFCADPEAVVCEAERPLKNLAADQARYGREVVAAALKAAGLTRTSLNRDERGYIRFVDELSARVGMPSDARLHALYSQSRSALLRVIEQHPALTDVREEFRRQVLSLTFFTPTELVRLDPRYFREACNELGDHAGIFTDEIPVKGKTVVSFCPLRRFMERAQSEAQFLRTIRFSLLHEMSHHIDFRSYRNLYQGLRDCYADGRNGRPAWTLNILQMGEVSADYMASEAMAELLRDHPIEARRSAMIKATRWYCGSEADYEHPDGKPRLNIGIFSHPRIAGWFGCSPAMNQPPLCALGN